MQQYITIIIPRDLQQNAVEDMQKMKQNFERKYNVAVEIIVEEGKQRE